MRCNGHAELCHLAYSEVAYATTHNAMSNEDAGWIAPNQLHGLTRQLADGVRGMMLDTHYGEDGVPSLCHGDCYCGRQALLDGPGEIAVFLSSGDLFAVVDALNGLGELDEPTRTPETP